MIRAFHLDATFQMQFQKRTYSASQKSILDGNCDLGIDFSNMWIYQKVVSFYQLLIFMLRAVTGSQIRLSDKNPFSGAMPKMDFWMSLHPSSMSVAPQTN